MTTDHQKEHPSQGLAELRQTLAGKKGRVYWRSLKELSDSEAFEKLVKEEFPRQAGLLDMLSRRDFLKVLGASLALAGLTACAPQEPKKLMPYTKPPEELVPGKPIFFASTMVVDGYGEGVLIKTNMGRPIKIDGNPQHPISLGGSDVFIQASVLDLYDPDRGTQVLNQGNASTWQDFVAGLGPVTGGLGDGAGLRILTGPVASPTLVAQLQELLDRYPQARWHQYSPLGRENTTAGAAQAFGQPYAPLYNFRNADVILSLDNDFLFAEPAHLRYSREFGLRHQPISTEGTMSRLYMVESSMTLTGSNADHRLGVKPEQVEGFARAVASRLGVNVPAPEGDVPGQNWLDPLVEDLRRAGGRALVLAGERQPAAVHALAFAMNQALGSFGSTVDLIDTAAFAPQDADAPASLGELVGDLNNGQVSLLVILECSNPAFSAPADLKFAEAMPKAQQSIYLGQHPDETAALATWYVPAAHYLEMWGDARAYDGTVSLIQPVIEPIFGGKSPYELVAALLGQGDANGYDLVRQFWQGELSDDFEKQWRAALAKGIVQGVEQPVVATPPGLDEGAWNNAAPAQAGEGLTLVFQPDYTIWDGRYANNAWLQETPKPITKLTWDNAALIGPATAERLGLKNNDLVELRVNGLSVQAPVFIEPGQPNDVVVVPLGYGRTAGGNLLEGLGFNAYALRTSQSPWFVGGLELSKTGGEYQLATTQEHWSVENRDIIHEATLEEYEAHPNFAQEAQHGEEASLYGEHEYPGYSWGMSINLNACIGCNACVVSCSAENNIPTVGKEGVLRSREMLWLRVDRYFSGTAERPQMVYAPVPCMHCDKAPCEPVCPVEATSHSAEGINEMTYSRCVGTRYCSNNCPYKVRRFNFFHYVKEDVVSLRAMRNPDVTVRSRGVMEKCTYCVQRVNHARIQAEVEGREIRDGEVTTACQDACPTRAIVFGNINDPNSQVRKLKDTPLNYGMLAELGTLPRTTYLAKVRNPNPLIEQQDQA